MRFEWDEAKNEANLLKHDLDFADAELVFAGPVLQLQDTRRNYGEDRFVGIGFLESLVVVVVFTRREPDIVRLISMRKATQDEKHRFQNALQNQLGSS